MVENHFQSFESGAQSITVKKDNAWIQQDSSKSRTWPNSVGRQCLAEGGDRFQLQNSSVEEWEHSVNQPFMTARPDRSHVFIKGRWLNTGSLPKTSSRTLSMRNDSQAWWDKPEHHKLHLRWSPRPWRGLPLYQSQHSLVQYHET